MIFIDSAAQPPFESGNQAIGCHDPTMINLTGGLAAMVVSHCPGAGGLAGQSQIIPAPETPSAGCRTFYHQPGSAFLLS